MAEERLWEPLVIIETGDIMSSGSERWGESASVAFDHSCDGKHTAKEEGKDKSGDSGEATVCSEERKQQLRAKGEEYKAEESKSEDAEQNKRAARQDGQTREKVSESLEDEGKVAKNQLQVDAECSTACEQQAKGTMSPEEEAKQVCGAFFLLSLSYFTVYSVSLLCFSYNLRLRALVCRLIGYLQTSRRRSTSCSVPCRRAGGSMTSAAPSG